MPETVDNPEIKKLLAEAEEVNIRKNKINAEIQSYRGTPPEEKDLTPLIGQFLDAVNEQAELINQIRIIERQ